MEDVKAVVKLEVPDEVYDGFPRVQDDLYSDKSVLLQDYKRESMECGTLKEPFSVDISGSYPYADRADGTSFSMSVARDKQEVNCTIEQSCEMDKDTFKQTDDEKINSRGSQSNVDDNTFSGAVKHVKSNQTHTGEDGFNNCFCAKIVNLKKQSRTHTDGHAHECDVCGESVSGDDCHRHHIKAHDGDRPGQCDSHGQTFSNGGCHRTHTKKHTTESPFKCDVCGRFFSYGNHLRRHMKTHTGEKLYRCYECGKTFSRDDHLRVHLRTHTGERPHECDVCGKSFSHRNNLTRHVRTHTGEKPYKCDVCGKTFIRGTHLTRHTRTHGGDMTPYM